MKFIWFYGGICEGIVIKPLIDYQTSNGGRVIIKNKNAKFAEKAKFDYKGDKEYNIIERPLFAFINDNRINNFISKEGNNLDIKNFSSYLKEIYDDALHDYQKEDCNIIISKDVQRIAMSKIAILLKKFINVKKV